MAQIEDEDKNGLADEIIELMKDDEMVEEAQTDELLKELLDLDKAALSSRLKSAQAYHEKISATKQSGVGNKPGRVIKMAGASTESKDALTYENSMELMP